MRIVESDRGDPVAVDVDLPRGVVQSERDVAGIGVDVEGDRWFDVTSTVQKDGPTGALIMWVFFNGRASIGRDAALAHWRDVHGLLAVKHHIGVCRYVQHVVVDGCDDRVEAIAELHFASPADLADRFYDSDDGRRAIAADIATFAGGYFETFIVRTEQS